MGQIPGPSVERLLQLTRVLDSLDGSTITSSEIESRTGWPSHTIRKDISFLPGASAGPSGYDAVALKGAITTSLGLGETHKFCVVGLGRLGSAYLNFPAFGDENFELLAGFDSSVNRLEILKSQVPLYPAYKIGEVVKRFGIELALLCVPAAAAQGCAEKLVSAGIRGIVNFAPVVLDLSADVVVRNVYVVDELRALAAKIYCFQGACR